MRSPSRHVYGAGRKRTLVLARATRWLSVSAAAKQFNEMANACIKQKGEGKFGNLGKLSPALVSAGVKWELLMETPFVKCYGICLLHLVKHQCLLHRRL